MPYRLFRVIPIASALLLGATGNVHATDDPTRLKGVLDSLDSQSKDQQEAKKKIKARLLEGGKATPDPAATAAEDPAQAKSGGRNRIVGLEGDEPVTKKSWSQATGSSRQ